MKFVLKRRFVLGAVVLAVGGCNRKVEPSTAPAQAQSAPSAPRATEKSVEGTQVKATLRLSKAAVRPGEELEVAVEMKIAPLWEIHPLEAKPAESATELELILPVGFRAAGEWTEPKTTRSMGASGQSVHVGKAKFTRTLVVERSAAGEHEIACRVRYQVCNERQCLKPEERTLRVPIEVGE